MGRQEVKVSVGELLRLKFPPSDLGGATEAMLRLQEGIRGHQLIRNRRAANYQTEVEVRYTYEWEDYRMLVRGRADGWVETETVIMVEEIKTTYGSSATLELSMYPVHEAQLQLYLYFAYVAHPEKKILGRLTYLDLADLAEKTFEVTFEPEQGKQFFEELAHTFLAARQRQDRWIEARDRSLEQWQFPFATHRPGQADLMELVDRALIEERDLFVEAATGIGKTIAVLYPVLKRLAGNTRFHQVFFLTAKSSGKEIVKKTLAKSAQEGLRLRTVFLEAKERICPRKPGLCEANECPYATDYYTKTFPILPELLSLEMLTAEVVAEYAEKYRVCPFELSLDLALQADLIVGDYNYLFDPGVYLRRFFVDRRDYVFLIDEAHNLVTRGREMYSAALGKTDIKLLQKMIASSERRLHRAIHAVEAYFEAWEEEMVDELSQGIRLTQLPELLETELGNLINAFEEYLFHNRRSPQNERLVQAFFTWVGFTRIAGLCDRDFAMYVKMETGGPKLYLRSINPGKLLRKRLDCGRTAIFFSATLSPERYFQTLLGGKPDALFIRMNSPFPQENRLYLHVPGVDTRYQARSRTVLQLTECVASLVDSHDGNYLVFLPSYAYLQMLLPFVKQRLSGRAKVFCQTPGMSSEDKEQFLGRLVRSDPGSSLVGLAVMGGMFGEGVDLPGEQLVGVVIVGPGLPMVNEEQEMIREYFDDRDGQGFFYAYLVPGLIRVIQSAGRVFRTAEDKGVVLLMDDRFLDERYQELLPPDWFAPGRTFSDPDYREVLNEFWQEG